MPRRRGPAEVAADRERRPVSQGERAARRRLLSGEPGRAHAPVTHGGSGPTLIGAVMQPPRPGGLGRPSLPPVARPSPLAPAGAGGGRRPAGERRASFGDWRSFSASRSAWRSLERTEPDLLRSLLAQCGSSGKGPRRSPPATGADRLVPHLRGSHPDRLACHPGQARRRGSFWTSGAARLDLKVRGKLSPTRFRARSGNGLPAVTANYPGGDHW